MKTKPNHIPSPVRQALNWLDRMGIAYRYIPDALLWEFVYDGLYMLLMNDCNDNEFGLYAPVLITDTDDEEVQKMVYECSVPSIEHVLSSNCDFGYHGEGLCHVAQWWGVEGKNPVLTKKAFVEKLKEMHKYQIEMHFILQGTYEGMFNPPEDVMQEVFKNINATETDEQ